MTTWLFLGVALLYPIYLEPINQTKLYLFLILVFITTFLIPFLSISIFKLSGVISSFEMPNRAERFVPLLFITSLYGLSLYFMYSKLALGINVIAIFLGITLLLLFLTFITLKWQISLHSAASSGIVGFLLAMLAQSPEGNLLLLCTIFILLAGLVASARLFLNAHTIEEVGTGSFLGFIVCFLTVYIIN